MDLSSIPGFTGGLVSTYPCGSGYTQTVTLTRAGFYDAFFPT